MPSSVLGRDPFSRTPRATPAAATPASIAHLGMIDHAFDHDLLAVPQRSNRHYSRTVLITQRQMKQQILHPVDPVIKTKATVALIAH